MNLKGIFCAVLTSCMLCSVSFAGGMNYNTPATNDWQYGVSGMYDNDIDNFALGLQVQNERFEAGIRTSADWNKYNNGADVREFHLGGNIGARKELKRNVYGSVGVSGIYTWVSGDWAQTSIVENNPYVVGAYLGLAYQPFPYFQTFLRIMPYSYEITELNQKKNEIFEHGQIGLAYFFN